MSSIVNLLWYLAKKWVKILIVPSFWLKFGDVTVTLSLIVLSRIFFTNSSWYYFTSCQSLLRLSVIFMVKKIGQLLLKGGRVPPPQAPSLCLILEPRWQVRFMGRCPKDESTGKSLVWRKSSSHFWEKLEKPVGGDATAPPPPLSLAIRGLSSLQKLQSPLSELQ